MSHLYKNARVRENALLRLKIGPFICEVQGYLAHKKAPTTLGLPKDPRHRPRVGS